MMRVSAHKLVALYWALLLAAVGGILTPYAVGGDQQHYREFYEFLVGMPIGVGVDFYKLKLGSGELGYFFLVWLVCSWMPRELFVLLLNFFLYYYCFLWLSRNRVSWVIYPLLACNFYLLVLSFSAERLKFAIVVLLVGYSLRGVFKYLLLCLAVLSHVQIVMLLVAAQVERMVRVVRDALRGRLGGEFVSLGLVFLGGVLLLFLLRNHIVSKLGAYYGVWGGVGSIIKPLIFMSLAVYYSAGRRAEAFLASIPMVVASYFVGSERVVIFSYFVFMYYAASYRRGLNFGVVGSAVFFACTGVGFVWRLVMFGDGFAGSY